MIRKKRTVVVSKMVQSINIYHNAGRSAKGFCLPLSRARLFSTRERRVKKRLIRPNEWLALPRLIELICSCHFYSVLDQLFGHVVGFGHLLHALAGVDR